jgi:hypothetical protein
MPAEDMTEFGGWPRPPRWVWAVAGVAGMAVLASVVVARTGPRHAATSSPASATAPVPGSRTPAAESAPQWWPSALSPCGPTVYPPQMRLWPPAGAPVLVQPPAGVPVTVPASGGDGTVRLWNPATGQSVVTPQTGTGPRRAVRSGFVSFSPQGALIASCSSASPSAARR